MSAAPQLKTYLKVQVEVVQGNHKGLKVSPDKSSWTIGRGPENDVILGQDIKVSRKHVQIQCYPTQVVVKNLNERNAMLVDGKAVNEAILRPNSHVQVGDSTLKVTWAPLGTATSKKEVAPKASAPSRPQGFAPAQGARPSSPGAWGSGAPSGAHQGGGLVPPFATREQPLLDNPQFRFYGSIVIVALVVLFILSGENAKRKAQPIRDSVAVTAEVSKSEEEVKRLLEERRATETPQYKAAQAHFVKGFRDYRMGQYARAIDAFMDARAADKDHVLAAKYLTLARRKRDETIQAYMQAGRRYLGTNNYRMCQSSFAAVMMQVKDDKNPIYREAKQFYDECRLKGTGP